MQFISLTEIVAAGPKGKTRAIKVNPKQISYFYADESINDEGTLVPDGSVIWMTDDNTHAVKVKERPEVIETLAVGTPIFQ